MGKFSWWKEAHFRIPYVNAVLIFQCSDVYAKLLQISDSIWMNCRDGFNLLSIIRKKMLVS